MASEDAYEALRSDARDMLPTIAALCAETRTPDPRDEKIDAQRQEIARLRVIVTRVVEIPREPEHLEDDDLGRAYLRGWQDARVLVDKAILPEGD